MESDESELMILKNRHEKTTDRPLDDLLVKLFMQKTVGPLQQHMRLNVRTISTFNAALTAPSGRVDHQGQADMDIGALKGRRAPSDLTQ